MTPRVAAVANANTALFMSEAFPVPETFSRRVGKFPGCPFATGPSFNDSIGYCQNSSSQLAPTFTSVSARRSQGKASMQLVTGALRIYAAPKLRRSTGLPASTLIGHDVEEFIGVVRRYSVAAAGVQAMIDAAARGRHRFRVR